MRGSKHMIHNTKLHRSQYTFEVFTKMFDAANCVLGEANLIEQRGRHEKYAHNSVFFWVLYLVFFYSIGRGNLQMLCTYSFFYL